VNPLVFHPGTAEPMDRPATRLTRSALATEREDRAGCVSLSYSRRTGALRGVYRAADQDLDTDSGKWATICEDHGTICQHGSQAAARATDTDDFCDECRERQDNAPKPAERITAANAAIDAMHARNGWTR